MDIISEVIDSLIRGTLLGVSLVLCGYGFWFTGTFLVKTARKLYHRIDSPANKQQ